MVSRIEYLRNHEAVMILFVLNLDLSVVQLQAAVFV